jgi:transcriptional regulator with XRE-family HTH domain
MENLLQNHIAEQYDPETEIFVNLCYDFIDEVHDTLKEKGWTQKDLADKMGKSPAEISKIINGMHNVTFKTVAKLSHALGKDLIYTNSKAISLAGEMNDNMTSIEIHKNDIEIPEKYDDMSQIGTVIIMKIGA